MMKKNEILSLVFIIVIMLIIFGGFINPIFFPVSINYDENRVANLIPSFSFKSFYDKSYQDAFEVALADQIPKANIMKEYLNTFKVNTKMVYYHMLPKENYHYLSNGVYLFNDYLIYGPRYLSEIKENHLAKIENINLAVRTLPNISFYLYYIEKDTDIDFRNLDKMNIYENLIETLDKSVKTSKFEINSFEEFANYFYKTDHHWNYKGSYKGYQDLVTLMSLSNDNNFEQELCLSSMSGSKASAIGGNKIFYEQFCAYLFNLKSHDVYINNEKVSAYGYYKDIILNPPENVSYAEYYGADFGLVLFDYHNKEKDNLLIIGESYDNAINELIASNFNKTYNVDLRAYETDMKEKFNFVDFVKKNKISKVLLIGNVDYYTLKEFNLIKEE